MPRPRRTTPAGYCDDVLSRGNARQRVFHTDEDHAAFMKLLDDAHDRRVARPNLAGSRSNKMLASCGPNHEATSLTIVAGR